MCIYSRLFYFVTYFYKISFCGLLTQIFSTDGERHFFYFLICFPIKITIAVLALALEKLSVRSAVAPPPFMS